MDNSPPESPIPFGEFVALMALMMALVAFVIDAILPALPEMGRDLGVARANDNQLVISLVFLGAAIGQLVVGPVSDGIGRKPTIYIGFAVFFAGCVVSLVSADLTTMLVGRFLQGLGLAAPRTVTMAIVRDCFEGRAMARVMSFTTVVFIFVPAIAPAFGQMILFVSDWRGVVMTFLIAGVLLVIWFGLRQPETLPPDRRLPLSFGQVFSAMREMAGNRTVVSIILAQGLLFGAFIGHLNSAQQIFQETYELGVWFPVFFAATALAVGASSMLNGWVVMQLGMRRLSGLAVVTASLLSVGYLPFVILESGTPALWSLMLYLMLLFFSFGFLFGNLNALVMEPLGHIAGIGAALIGAISTFIAIPIGVAIGQSFDGGVLPLVAGFAINCSLMWVLLRSTGVLRTTDST